MKLQVSKGHSVAVHAHSSFKKTTSPASEWDYVPEPLSKQQSFTSSVALDSSGREAVEQVSVVEDEGDLFHFITFVLIILVQ